MDSEISFSQQIKEELVDSFEKNSDEKNIAILSSFIKINGNLNIADKQESLVLKTENNKIAEGIYYLLNKYFPGEVYLDSYKTSNLNKNTKYQIKVSSRVDEILSTLEIDFFQSKISKKFLNTKEKIRGYIIGIFLAAGSCSSPKNSNYHLELKITDPNYAISVQSLLNNSIEFAFNFRLIKRKYSYVIYIKKSDKISDFLKVIGAITCCFEFENYRMERETINNQNRLINIDGWNYQRTYLAAKRQIEIIEYLEKYNPGVFVDKEDLRQYAIIRKEFPEASLQEIADIMSERLDRKISKGKVNHLKTKIDEYGKYYNGK